MGTWSAKSYPKILLEPYAIYKEQSPIKPEWPIYETSTAYVVPSLSDFNINPVLLQNAEKVEVVYDIFRDDEVNDNVVVGPKSTSEPYGRISYQGNEKLYEHLYKSDYGKIEIEVPILNKDGDLWEHSQDYAPYEIFLANVPNGPQGAKPTILINPSQIVVMGIKITTKDGQTIVSTHKFKPVYDWNYSRYNSDKTYLQEYPCIPAEEL